MEKSTGPIQVGASSAFRPGWALSMVAAALGPLCVIFMTGYLTIQLQLAEILAPLLDLSSRPVPVTGEWVPYAVRAGFVLLGVAAVLGYRVVARTTPSRVIALTVLVIAAFAGVYRFRPLPWDEEPTPIALFSLMNGAASPFTLALIGAVIVDLISARRRRRSIPLGSRKQLTSSGLLPLRRPRIGRQ